MIFVFLFLFALIVRFLLMNRGPSATAAGAIVMAIGIFEYDVFNHFLFFSEEVSKYIAFLLVIIWFFIICSYLSAMFKNTFKQHHTVNIIPSYAMGTWVAASSVCATIVHDRIPELSILAVIIMFLNSFLWIYYLFICFRNFKILFRTDSFRQVHGVALLSTVSTQSLVVAFSKIFKPTFYLHSLSHVLLYVGIAFYLICLFMIMKRYLLTWHSLDIKKDWFNTNCVIHGAMSITGLAAVVSHTFESRVVLFIWFWVLVWFVIIEVIELYRAYERIKQMGIIEGIVKYDVSQWTRNFTFGMLYAFTLNVNVKGTSSFVQAVHNGILKYGVVLVLGLLTFEIFLFLKHNLSLKYIKALMVKEGERTENF